MSRAERHVQSYEEAADDSRAFLASWRARGGYEGAMERTGSRLPAAREPRSFAAFGCRAAVGHMPFPHKHCGEWR